MIALTEKGMRYVESIADRDGRVRCHECDEAKGFRSDGRAERYKGDVRFRLFCKNGHILYMDFEEQGARQLGLPIPPYRRSAPPRRGGGAAPYA